MRQTTGSPYVDDLRAAWATQFPQEPFDYIQAIERLSSFAEITARYIALAAQDRANKLQSPILVEMWPKMNKPSIIVIPVGNWHTALAQAVRTAPEGATIVVDDDAKRELGEIAAGPDRLNRPDLTFIVEGGER